MDFVKDAAHHARTRVNNLVVRGEGNGSSDGDNNDRGIIDNIKDRVKVRLENLPHDIDQLKAIIKDQAEEFHKEKMELIRQYEDDKKRDIKAFFQNKLEKGVDHGMNVANRKLKEAVKDPYMPQFVMRWIDDMIDGMWPDIKVEMKELIIQGIYPEPQIQHGSPPTNILSSFLAWLRYNIYPYDRSIWRQLRNPIFVIFQIASLIPRYGIPVMVYTIIFLIIDKRDEHQLLQYIVQFKSLQFINLGIVSSVIGAVQYYVCVSESPPTCNKYAPQEPPYTIGLFILQLVLVWISFLFLRGAKRKGGYFYQLKEEYKEQLKLQTHTKNERLRLLDLISDDNMPMNIPEYADGETVDQHTRKRLMDYLWYDLTVFAACCAVTVAAAFANRLDPSYDVTKNIDGANNWKFEMTLYWIKAAYGMCSVPFIFLLLPVVSTLISHAKPTGYNPYGVTVPYRGVEEEQVPWRNGPPSIPPMPPV